MSLLNAIRNRFRSVSPSQLALSIPLRSHWRLVGAAVGIAVAALGQVVIMSDRVFDYPVLTPLADAVFDVFKNPTAVMLGVILLAAGGALFAATVTSDSKPDDSEPDDSEVKRLGPDTLTVRIPNSRLFVGVLLVAAALHAYVWLQLARGNYETSYPILFFIGIALVALACFYLDKESGIDLKFRIGVLEVAFLVVVTGAFIALNVSDIRNWYYSADESYTIYTYVSSIAEGAERNLFSQHGARPWEPTGQYYQVAAVMKVFGVDYFGWRLAVTLFGAAIFVPLYFLVRTLFNVRVAVTAAALLVAAHVLMAFAHYGWTNIIGIYPSLLAFALFFAGVKRGSALLIFGAGVAAGLGFYVFMTARITLPALLLFGFFLVLLLRYRVYLRHNLFFLFLGFLLAVTPMLIVSNIEIITETSRESLFNYKDPNYVVDPVVQIKNNFLINSTAFNFGGGSYNVREIYTSGSLLEPVTAVLAVLGLAYAVKRFREPRFLFLLTWFAIALGAIGLNSPHRDVVISRLNYMIPIMAIFAAIALGAAYTLLRRSFSNSTLRTVAPPLLLSLLLLVVLGSNLYRFWEVTPANTRSSPAAVAMKAALSSECRDSDRQSVVVAPISGGTLLLAITARDWGRDRTPVILAYEEMERVTEFSPTSCVIYQPETEPPPTEDLARLRRLTGAQQVTSEYDHSGERRVIVLK